MSVLLEAEGLTRVYRRGAVGFAAVDRVDLKLEAGEFAGIIGRSGSGKSTLLHLIAGILRPTAGSVSVAGQNVSEMNDAQVSAYRNQRIGFVAQGQTVLSNLTALDNVRLPAYLGDTALPVTERARALLDQVGITHLADAYPGQLSGGELRRVAIARALINRPQLLIADEPTSDLDAQTTAGILRLLAAIAREGTGVLMVTHELDSLRFFHTTYRMEAGALSLEVAPRS